MAGKYRLEVPTVSCFGAELPQPQMQWPCTIAKYQQWQRYRTTDHIIFSRAAVVAMAVTVTVTVTVALTLTLTVAVTVTVAVAVIAMLIIAQADAMPSHRCRQTARHNKWQRAIRTASN